jgi:hypothetical protein
MKWILQLQDEFEELLFIFAEKINYLTGEIIARIFLPYSFCEASPFPDFCLLFLKLFSDAAGPNIVLVLHLSREGECALR